MHNVRCPKKPKQSHVEDLKVYFVQTEMPNRLASFLRTIKVLEEAAREESKNYSTLATDDDTVFNCFSRLELDMDRACKFLCTSSCADYNYLFQPGADKWKQLLLYMHVEAHLSCEYVPQKLCEEDVSGFGLKSRCAVPAYTPKKSDWYKPHNEEESMRKIGRSVLLWGHASVGDPLTGESSILCSERQILELRGPLRRVNSACSKCANVKFYIPPGMCTEVVEAPLYVVVGVATKRVNEGDMLYANYTLNGKTFKCANDGCNITIKCT